MSGVRQVGYFDCPGGGQVVVSGTTAYVAHMKAPHGTTIVDVSDPARPRAIAELSIPADVHSHKVRVVNGVMLVNWEAGPRSQPGPDFKGGLGIWDVTAPARPREIAFWRCNGVHRFTFDGRYAYLSPDLDGYVGNIVMTLDLKDPAKPEEVGRWWMPGQWKAGGETPTWKGRAHRCHHPIRLGNRLYVSYWHGGFVILDVEDMAKPKLVSGLDWSPPFTSPTHPRCPSLPADGRKVLLVADEDAAALAVVARLPVAGGHQRGDASGTVRQLPGGRHRRLAAAGVHRLPPAVRGGARHRDPGGVVRPRPAHRGHRQSARAARGGLVHAPVPAGADECAATTSATTTAA
jgi:hypothetical protein